ncbi:MAG: M48 family metallopeptidase [Bacteroidota bacterium]
MEANTLLNWIIGIAAGSFLLEQILSFLNLKNHSAQLPGELEGRYDPEKYAKSYAYHKERYRFGLLRSVISFVILMALLLLGGFGWLDGQLREYTTHPILLPLLFFGVLFIASDVMGIPFQLYSTFVIEEKYGFNRTTSKTFVLDKLKGYVLGIIMGGLIMGVLLWLVHTLGSGFWLWFWVFITAVMLFMNMFYTSLILPLFNKLTPMETGELRSAIESYSQGVNFPLDNIFIMDGSKRSKKANAFFSGLGKQKKVVLFDTLVDEHSQEELVAVLAHEVGHYKKKHIIQSLVIGILQTGLTLFLLSLFIQSPVLSNAMGGDSYGIHLNLLAFGILYSPISTLIGIFMNIFSRKNEFEADNYAATTYAAAPLREALIRLHQENLSNLTPHPWYVFFNYSHPPLLQRLRELEG